MKIYIYIEYLVGGPDFRSDSLVVKCRLVIEPHPSELILEVEPSPIDKISVLLFPHLLQTCFVLSFPPAVVSSCLLSFIPSVFFVYPPFALF